MVESIKNVSVIGAGTMGSGIALVLASVELSVTIVDVDQQFLDKGLANIKRMLHHMVSKHKITKTKMEQILTNIKPRLKLDESVSNAQLVIEAINEDQEMKKQLFMQLDQFCPSSTIIASNTSALSISDLARVTTRADRVIGMHFFNPPIIMDLVEVVKGKETHDDVVDTIIDFCKKIAKIPILTTDSPGFVVNRLLWPFLNEAYSLIESGVATIEDIDQAIKIGLKHPMGPLELSDYIGLDVLLQIGDYIASKEGKKHTPSTLLRTMVKEGKLGRKSGRGFYVY